MHGDRRLLPRVQCLTAVGASAGDMRRPAAPELSPMPQLPAVRRQSARLRRVRPIFTTSADCCNSVACTNGICYTPVN